MTPKQKLMVLAGNTVLSHAGHYTKKLDKFDIDEFEGDRKTYHKSIIIENRSAIWQADR